MAPPTLTLTAGAPRDAGAPAVALLTRSPGTLAELWAPPADLLGVPGLPDPALVLSGEQAKGEPGEVVVVPLARSGAPFRLLLVGAGGGDEAGLRGAGAAIARRAGARERVVVAVDLPPAGLAAFAEGIGLGGYGFSRRAEPPTVLREAVLVVPDPTDAAARAAVERAGAVVAAVHLARDLINTPSLTKTPEWMAEQALATTGLTVEVLGPDDLMAGGFGGLLAVGAGSPRGPRLVRLSYEPDAARAPGSVVDPEHVVLVGKGITFDSGGLSLKPTTSMVGMKTDMSGAAAVLATMAALPGLGGRRRVTGLLCLAENMIDGAAMRPGDVIRPYGGTRSVEVLNTDAEGRLVLADGLAYAAAALAPTQIVDLATLTGAVSVALGRRTAGLYSTDDTLAADLTTAAERAGERVWRMPLVEDYLPAVVSPIADLANTGRYAPVQGGSITAALFLRPFAGGVPWAHLDIAGPARSDSDDGEISKGGTGWGVRTLLTWLAG